MTVSTRAKLIIAFVIVIAIIGVLIQTAIAKASTYYITVNELYSDPTSAMASETSVSGNIVGSSVDWDPETSTLKFSMKDANGARELPVVFHGDKPDDFTGDWPVIVFGKLDANHSFVANKLLVKCPSKYKVDTRTYSAKS